MLIQFTDEFSRALAAEDDLELMAAVRESPAYARFASHQKSADDRHLELLVLSEVVGAAGYAAKHGARAYVWVGPAAAPVPKGHLRESAKRLLATD